MATAATPPTLNIIYNPNSAKVPCVLFWSKWSVDHLIVITGIVDHLISPPRNPSLFSLPFINKTNGYFKANWNSSLYFIIYLFNWKSIFKLRRKAIRNLLSNHMRKSPKEYYMKREKKIINKTKIKNYIIFRISPTACKIYRWHWINISFILFLLHVVNMWIN